MERGCLESLSHQGWCPEDSPHLLLLHLPLPVLQRRAAHLCWRQGKIFSRREGIWGKPKIKSWDNGPVKIHVFSTTNRCSTQNSFSSFLPSFFLSLFLSFLSLSSFLPFLPSSLPPFLPPSFLSFSFFPYSLLPPSLSLSLPFKNK
jgi:hypothetical protein